MGGDDIKMLWYNSKMTEGPQSNYPWGNSWVSDTIKQQYSDQGWEQVADDYVPVIILTAQQKITNLNAQYQSKFETLAQEYSSAVLSDSDNISAKQEALESSYQALISEKVAARTAILNGTDSFKLKATGAVYFCPDCGNTLVWDAGGLMSGAGFDCWYCSDCGNIIPPDGTYPSPS